CGAEIDVPGAAGDSGVEKIAATLFGESASRVLVSVDPTSTAAVLEAAAAAGVPAAKVGTTGGTRIRMAVDGRPAIDLSVAEAEAAWSEAIGRQIDGQVA